MNTVLFDIGNVLASDFWEAIWLTPGSGLADRLAVPVSLAAEVGKKLWRHYSLTPGEEADYWCEIQRSLGKQISAAMIQESELSNIHANPRARGTISSLVNAGCRVGVISNNTSFWAPKQLAKADVASLIDRDLCFISSELHADKTRSEPNLFHIAARRVDAAKTLIVDDRPHNLATAGTLGFQTFLYGPATNTGRCGGGYYAANNFDKLDLMPSWA